MSHIHSIGLLITEERTRCAGLVIACRQDWERFAEEHGENSEVAVWTLIAELDALEARILRPNASKKQK